MAEYSSQDSISDRFGSASNGANNYSSFSSISSQYGAATVTPELPPANDANTFGTGAAPSLVDTPKNSGTFTGTLEGAVKSATGLANALGGAYKSYLNFQQQKLDANIAKDNLKIRTVESQVSRDVALARLESERSVEILKAKQAGAIATENADRGKNVGGLMQFAADNPVVTALLVGFGLYMLAGKKGA